MFGRYSKVELQGFVFLRFELLNAFVENSTVQQVLCFATLKTAT